MTNIPVEQGIDGVIKHKVQNRVAKKVMKDIHRHVDKIEQQVQTEKKAASFLIPFLILLAGIIISLFFFWSGGMRFISALVN